MGTYYIIEYSEGDKQWTAIMPETAPTPYGVLHTTNTMESSFSLDTILDRVYEHRDVYQNWESEIFLNGKPVLFVDTKRGPNKWVRFHGGEYMKVDLPKRQNSPDDTITIQDYL